MKKIITYGLIATTLGQSIVMSAEARRRGGGGADAGTIIGGIIGGIIGNDASHGNGAVTAIGVIAGALIGREVGRSLDEADRRAYREAQMQCLDHRRLNDRVVWQGSTYGSSTGSYGEFVVLREGRHYQSSRVCRQYESVIYSAGRREVNRGYACQYSDGSWIETQEREVVFASTVPVVPVLPAPVYPVQPVQIDNGYGHRPNPSPYYPRPGNGYDRRGGYCADYDHSQFYAAKSFSYSTAGLDLTDREATDWALWYNQTHACNTLEDYRREFVTIKSFAYTTAGLDLSSLESIRLARSWADRGYCGSDYEISQMQQAYRQDYSFAYSTRGLNLDTRGARRYAVDRIRTACSDLLRNAVH